MGTSGSGKTTLIKTAFSFLSAQQGVNQNKRYSAWRHQSPFVASKISSRDAGRIYIFRYNTQQHCCRRRYHRQAKTASCRREGKHKKFIKSLPLKYNTKIGMEGNGISQGRCQRLRLLIARAVYKNPDFLFWRSHQLFSASNEKIILDILNSFYKGKTVIIVAHRLSIVQRTDNILVMDNSKTIEECTHKELTDKRGAYYTLVRNQLELGV